ncbi:kinase-like domain-containing protein [Fomitopsis serialis]|uniref:kinase-like domain-containing protein n=1 Tax=Fomitopsis serialis TaxID=139415 RepID=UPI002007F8F6|nr:kinase-like domain-containing protein [Neoantrodia serialis]KAH9914460.1 kinase-like domain-containing protein [Neoantrodia serialis]
MLASWSGHLSPSPSTDSNSTRSSHLSLLSSASSISSPPSAPSPLPSPSPSIASIGNKTHAFFGSPWEGSPTPMPPPKLQLRIQSSDNGHGAHPDETPRMPQETPRIEQRVVPKRSLNEEFFGPSTLPTPPPTSARLLTPSISSRESSYSPPSTHRTLPPSAISRLFPSRRRYASEDNEPPELEPTPTHRREFLQLDTDTAAPSYADAFTASPAVAQFPIPKVHPDSSNMPTPLPHPTEHERTSFIPSERNTKPLPPVPLLSVQPDPVVLEQGTVLRSTSLSVRLERVLGQGAFSSVWLASDLEGQVGVLELSRRTSLLRSKSQKRGRRLEGTRPKASGIRAKGPVPMQREKRLNVHERVESEESVTLRDVDATPRPDEIAAAMGRQQEGRLVAVKMTERTMCEKNSRSRVSFVREVEILRHIAHPSIVSYVHSFSTPAQHCLVLEYVGGGELFDLIGNPESHARLDEPLLRRMFGELCKAVGWMHGVGLVHRDIKLESTHPSHHLPVTSTLPAAPASLIKLSDFGLSRFIDPAKPLLTTLCGSESYAAPELVTGRPYDGRETDAWACGVVLYALAARRLPFDRVVSREREEGCDGEGRGPAVNSKAERRALLMRIAKTEYSWPEDDTNAVGETILAGAQLARSAGVRRVVERLLVRNPANRARIIDLWEEEWMRGEGAPFVPQGVTHGDVGDALADADATPVPAQIVDAHCDADVEDDDGLIVDEQDIGPGSVAHQEH